MSGRPCDSEHATNRFPQKVAALRLANRSHRMALCTGSHSPTVAVRRHPKRREPESRFTPLARGLLLRAVAVIRMIKRMHPGRLGRQRVAIRLITLYPPISAHARTRRLTIPHPAVRLRAPLGPSTLTGEGSPDQATRDQARVASRLLVYQRSEPAQVLLGRCPSPHATAAFSDTLTASLS